MQKTITIAIGSLTFQLEEDGFRLLERYLAELKAHFASYPDSTEILSDFESRIAEKLSELPAGRPVTAAEVTSVTESLGHAADFGEAAPPRQQPQKKLYRSSEDQLVGGVCSGLAAYLGWDVAWVRIAFVIFSLFNGIGVAIYLLLWLVIPEAKTAAEKLRMQGEPLTVKNIEEAVKQRVEEVRQKDPRPFVRLLRLPFQLLGQLLLRIGQLLRALVRPIGAIIGALLGLAGALGIAAATFVLVTVLFNIGTPYVDPIVTAIPRGPWLYVGLWAAFFTLLVPLLMLVQLSGLLTVRKSLISKGAAVSLVVLWVVAAAAAASSALRIVPQVQAIVASDPRFMQQTRELAVSNFDELSVGSSYHVEVHYGETPSVVASGPAVKVERIQLIQNGSVVELRDHNCGLCFDGGDDVRIVVTTPGLQSVSGSGASEITFAQEQAENIAIKLSGASRAEVVLNGPSVDFELSGASRLTATGMAENISGKLSGASKLSAEHADVLESTLELSGASRASFGELQLLHVKASGASHVTYRGTPEVDQELSGSSNVGPDTQSRLDIPDPEFYPDQEPSSLE